MSGKISGPKDKATKQKVALLFATLTGSVVAANSVFFAPAVERGASELVKSCATSSLLDCNFTIDSTQALVLGFPLAWWAFTYYLWLFAVVVWTLFFAVNEKPLLVMALFISTLAISLTIYKGFELMFQLSILCIVCLTLCFINFFIVFLLTKLLSLNFKKTIDAGKLTALEKRTRLDGNHTAIFVSVMVSLSSVILVGYLTINRTLPVAPSAFKNVYTPSKSNLAEDQENNAVDGHFSQMKRVIELVPDAPLLGHPQAEITIVVFNDFACPFCQMAALQLRKILSEFRNHVKLYLVHFPVDGVITESVSSAGDRYAGIAARASIYAYDKGQFWPFHDELFQRQSILNAKIIRSMAKRYGWDMNDFIVSVDGINIINRLKKHIDCGQSVGVQGTPTIYVNGRLLRHWENPNVVRKVLVKEIQLTKGTQHEASWE